MKAKTNISYHKPYKPKDVFPLKIKRIRTDPRQCIRQLLRSFIPLANLKQTGQSDSSFPTEATRF